MGNRVKTIALQLLQILLQHLVTDGRVLFAIDDSPTKRYGPHVQGAGIHHNPTPGPADQTYLYGHIWVTISLVLRYRLWNTIGLPLLGLLYVRAKDVGKIPPRFKWKFRTKLELAVKFFFCTDPAATVIEIIEAFADRACIEQDFHDVKEVGGAGQQQVRVIWTNIACFNLSLWVPTLLECWAWHKPVDEIRDRSEVPWDDPDRRPSHADRRKALRRLTLQNHFSHLQPAHRRSSKIRTLYNLLLKLAT